MKPAIAGALVAVLISIAFRVGQKSVRAPVALATPATQTVASLVPEPHRCSNCKGTGRDARMHRGPYSPNFIIAPGVCRFCRGTGDARFRPAGAWVSYSSRGRYSRIRPTDPKNPGR